MDNNLRSGKSCLVMLRLLFRRVLHVYLLSSILDGSHLSWLAISAWVSILLLLLIDFLAVRVLLLFLFFPHRSFFFSFVDFVFQAGLKSLHLRAHHIQQSHTLAAFSPLPEWAFFALLCYEALLLILGLLYRLFRSSSSSSGTSRSLRARSRTHKSFGRINGEEAESLNEELRPRSMSAPQPPQVQKAPGDYRSYVCPAILVFLTSIVLIVFGLVTLVSGVAIVGLELAQNPYHRSFLWVQVSNWAAFGDVAAALFQDLLFMCLGRRFRQTQAEIENFQRVLFSRYESHRFQEQLNQK